MKIRYYSQYKLELEISILKFDTVKFNSILYILDQSLLFMNNQKIKIINIKI